MLPRKASALVLSHLQRFPAVAVLGPRQVGKTTLALEICGHFEGSHYLDLESPADSARLAEPELYLDRLAGRLVVIDEVQRRPDLFPILRSLIDRRRRSGDRTGQFLLLGSASLDLVGGAAESLAGRIAYVDLPPLLLPEVGAEATDRLWLRGGYPDSFLAQNDADSLAWRRAFIRSYLERDIPALAPRIPAETLRRFWTMLAHAQGGILNQSRLAASLGVSVPTIARYLDLLVDLLLVRRLEPWHANIGKRLVKSPKIYLRDSGIVHALLGIESLDDLSGHPVLGASWEGFVIDNLTESLPDRATTWLYRTSGGAELDLVVDFGPQRRVAVEIKRSLTPTLGRGFHQASADLEATERFVVYPGRTVFPLSADCDAVPLMDAIGRLAG